MRPRVVWDVPKRCSRCGVWKIWDDFHLDATRADGRCCWCKECKNAATREWYYREVERTPGLKGQEQWHNGRARREFNKQFDEAMLDQVESLPEDEREKLLPRLPRLAALRRKRMRSA